jgi:hypothetical protein
MKIFLWRIINDIIAVRSELHIRGIKCPILCATCCFKIETTTHTFMGCPRLNIRFQDKSEMKFKDCIINIWHGESSLFNSYNSKYLVYSKEIDFWEQRHIPEEESIVKSTNCIRYYQQAASSLTLSRISYSENQTTSVVVNPIWELARVEQANSRSSQR